MQCKNKLQYKKYNKKQSFKAQLHTKAKPIRVLEDRAFVSMCWAYVHVCCCVFSHVCVLRRGQVGKREIQISSPTADGLHGTLSKLCSSPSLTTEYFSMSQQGPKESKIHLYMTGAGRGLPLCANLQQVWRLPNKNRLF